MNGWTFQFEIFQLNNFLFGFRYSQEERIDRESAKIESVSIHQLGIGIVIITFERYKN